MLEYIIVDRRPLRTRESLKDALLALILEKPYDEITVQNILDRANVGRSAFYSHYRDKEDLFRGDWEKFIGFVVQSIDFHGLDENSFVPITMIFQHLIDFHPLYRALAKSNKTHQLTLAGIGLLTTEIEIKTSNFLGRDQQSLVPIPILANYIATQIFALLKWWLDHNMPCPPERMDDIFHDLVSPGVRNAFGQQRYP
jgi:AcrR family transcriptional regulator